MRKLAMVSPQVLVMPALRSACATLAVTMSRVFCGVCQSILRPFGCIIGPEMSSVGSEGPDDSSSGPLQTNEVAGPRSSGVSSAPGDPQDTRLPPSSSAGNMSGSTSTQSTLQGTNMTHASPVLEVSQAKVSKALDSNQLPNDLPQTTSDNNQLVGKPGPIGVEVRAIDDTRHAAPDNIDIRSQQENRSSSPPVDMKCYPRPAVDPVGIPDPSVTLHPAPEPSTSVNAGSDARAYLPSITILDVPVDSLGCEGGAILDIARDATPCRYRLVKCTDLLERDVLKIEEFESFPQVRYTAISYVWRGSAPDPEHPEASFSVKGAEDGDPISIPVLRHAAIASLHLRSAYLWFDRLCIIQTSSDDRSWQIRRMHDIYKRCSHAVILPGGVQRLVHLDEDTGWMHRGWTLQEALAPPFAVVLFAWRLGWGETDTGAKDAGLRAKGVIVEVVAGESAMASLVTILDACVAGMVSFAATSDRCTTSDELDVKTCILGAASPNAVALAAAFSFKALNGEEDQDAFHHAVWQSALLRTSKRSVDMVLSIMGLFGVKLNPEDFGADERAKATIALTMEILKSGGRATWLGVSLGLPRSALLATFPAFPETSVAGSALLLHDGNMVEVTSLVDTVVFPNTLAMKGMQMPAGTMDEDGRLSFVRRAKRLIPMARDAYLRARGDTGTILRRGENKLQSPCVAMDGSIWQIAEEEDIEPKSDVLATLKVYAVILGWYGEYHPGGTPAHDSFQVKAMVVVEDAPDKHSVLSFISWSLQHHQWPLSWPEKMLHIRSLASLPLSHGAGPHPGAISIDLVTDDDIRSGDFDPDVREFHGRGVGQSTVAKLAREQAAHARTQVMAERRFARSTRLADKEMEVPTLLKSWDDEPPTPISEEHRVRWRSLAVDECLGMLHLRHAPDQYSLMSTDDLRSYVNRFIGQKSLDTAR